MWISVFVFVSTLVSSIDTQIFCNFQFRSRPSKQIFGCRWYLSIIFAEFYGLRYFLYFMLDILWVVFCGHTHIYSNILTTRPDWWWLKNCGMNDYRAVINQSNSIYTRISSIWPALLINTKHTYIHNNNVYTKYLLHTFD